MFRRRSKLAVVMIGIVLTACGSAHKQDRAGYSLLDDVESSFGPLIAAANHPTANQHGTGERIGLFQDSTGTVWGLPLAVNGGTILVCAPSQLHAAAATDTFPAGSTVIGSMNEPTGWRGGTGDLELLLRDEHHTIHREIVHGAPLPGGPVCWAPDSPGPPQPLQYYRLTAVGR